MRRRSLVAGLVVLLVALVALASQSQPASPEEGGLVAIANMIVQMLQFLGIMGGAVAILVVVVRAGRTLGTVQQQLTGLTEQLSRYVDKNDEEHRSMQGRLGKVETRTARLEGVTGRGGGQ